MRGQGGIAFFRLTAVLAAVQNLTDLAESLETAVSPGFPNCRIRVPERSPSRVIGLRFPSLEEHDFEVRHHVDQPGQGVQSLRDLRAPQTAGLVVAVPRVGVPWVRSAGIRSTEASSWHWSAAESSSFSMRSIPRHGEARRTASTPGRPKAQARGGLDQLVHCGHVWKVHTGELLSFHWWTKQRRTLCPCPGRIYGRQSAGPGLCCGRWRLLRFCLDVTWGCHRRLG
jgi:hypothetical protein